MTDAFSRASTRNSKWIKTPPEVLYRAFTDSAVLAVWQAPEEIARAVIWLCSDASSFVTGVPMPIDGGWTAH